VITEAYMQGVSTRKVEALVQSLGIAGSSKSEVSRLCAGLDEQAHIFRTRRLDAAYPYVWLDARYEKVREDGRVISMAVIVAYAVRADGVRAVLGIEVGLSEDVVLWRAFLQDLVARGVRGVKLVTSDAHPGLKQAIAEVFVGSAWQRCRVHRTREEITCWYLALRQSRCRSIHGGLPAIFLKLFLHGFTRLPMSWMPYQPACNRRSRRPCTTS
jgi:transposase-like protein